MFEYVLKLEYRLSCLNMCGIQVVMFEYVWNTDCHV